MNDMNEHGQKSGDDGHELDFDTAWSKFMNEQQNTSLPEEPSTPDAPPSPVLNESEHRRLLNAKESDAFTRFFDTLMQEPTSPGISARKLEEELQQLSKMMDSSTSDAPEGKTAGYAEYGDYRVGQYQYPTQFPGYSGHDPGQYFPSVNPNSSQSAISNSNGAAMTHSGNPMPVNNSMDPFETNKQFYQGYDHGYYLGFTRALEFYKNRFQNQPSPRIPPEYNQNTMPQVLASYGPDPSPNTLSAPFNPDPIMQFQHQQQQHQQQQQQQQQQPNNQNQHPPPHSETSGSKRKRPDDLESRLTHTENEKRRRTLIKSLFEEMNSLVPDVKNGRRDMSKSVCIDKAYDYILQLSQENEQTRAKLASQGINTDNIPRVTLDNQN